MSLDAALVFTARTGWHLQPSPELEQLVATKTPPPRSLEEDDVTTTAEHHRRQTETTALRLLRDGYSLRQVSESTGLPENDLARLAADFPRSNRRPTSTCQHLLDLPIDQLLAHPGNIRTDLDVDPGLVETVAEHGVLQPVLVMPTPDGYVLLDGHRRLEAARRAGIARIPIRIHDRIDTPDATLVMLVTGLQKRDLDPLDEAAAYQQLVDAGHNQQSIAQAIGKNQGHVSQRLSLLLLTDAEKDALRRREITVDQAYHVARQRGSRRMSGKQDRPKPKRVPHFTTDHPLAERARANCLAEGHAVVLKLGPACGPCWEHVIRADAHLSQVGAA